MSREEFLEQFAEDEENKKVVVDFYPLSSNIVMFQQFEVLVEGLLLLEEIMKKHLDFMTKCKLGASLRKSAFQLLVVVLLDMQHTRLENSNLKKALEWKNALKDLLFMKFGVQIMLDKIRTVAESCITRDNENKLNELELEIADLEKKLQRRQSILLF